jgi:dienelactone hydrolase
MVVPVVFVTESDTRPNASRGKAYVVLFGDSFAPRGISQTCLADAKIVDRVSDALGTLSYLASQSFVRSDRIAVIGASQGGGAALETVRLNGPGAEGNTGLRPPLPITRSAAISMSMP